MRLYSPEWVAAFNEAVACVEVDPQVAFRMLQVVHGGPDGTFNVALVADGGTIVLERDPPADARPQVTVSVRWEDAAALARGELDPAQLLAAGRVKVRGDLSVLVRGQSVLAAAMERLGPLSDSTSA